jgi:peptidyl-prolyl cis-trans isomerase C
MGWKYGALLVGALAACTTTSQEVSGGSPPQATAIAFEQSQAAKDAPAPEATAPSRSDVLGYVEGEVITRREVQQLVAVELAQLEDPADRAKTEDQALLVIARRHMMYRAARDAGVTATRDEIDRQREDHVRELAKSGSTLEAYLHEHNQTRRELDEELRRDLVIGKFQAACSGVGREPGSDVRVRPWTFVDVTPEEVRKYYDDNPELFRFPELAKVRMLQVKTDLSASGRVAATETARQRAEAARARLAAGEDWSPVYREINEGDHDPQDGLSEIPRGKVADWIEEFAFAQPKGTLSPVIQRGTTFYVLLAEGSRPARTVPFEEVEAGIRRKIFNAKAQAALLEVELNVLDQSSIQPETLRQRVRDTLRRMRTAVLDAGRIR